jgi:hypothetical protein
VTSVQRIQGEEEKTLIGLHATCGSRPCLNLVSFAPRESKPDGKESLSLALASVVSLPFFDVLERGR